MSLFTENLPMTIVIKKGMPDEKKYQGIFRQIIASAITIFFPVDSNVIPLNESIHINYYAKQYLFEFETKILQLENDILIVEKPINVIRSRQRISKRIKINIPVQFTVWTKEGNYQGEITNLSSVGCRMMSPLQLMKEELVSIHCDLEIAGHQLQFVTQGFVVWNSAKKEGNDWFLHGINFTTIDEDKANYIDKLIDEIYDHNPNYNENVSYKAEHNHFLKNIDGADKNSLSSRYHAALDHLSKSKYDDAEKQFNEIWRDSFSGDEGGYKEKSLLELQKIYLRQRRYLDAIYVGLDFIKNFSRSEKLKELIYNIAKAYEGMGNLEKAIDYFGKVENLQPNDQFSEEARKRIKILT